SLFIGRTLILGDSDDKDLLGGREKRHRRADSARRFRRRLPGNDDRFGKGGESGRRGNQDRTTAAEQGRFYRVDGYPRIVCPTSDNEEISGASQLRNTVGFVANLLDYLRRRTPFCDLSIRQHQPPTRAELMEDLSGLRLQLGGVLLYLIDQSDDRGANSNSFV